MIRLNIDGREVNGLAGQTILEVARENGLHIPTLCYDEQVKIYGGCGLCVVESEDNSKLLRACATEITPGMVVFTNSPRVRESRKLTLELLLSDHGGDCLGPCTRTCPAHLDVQGYVGLIANRQYREAVKLLKQKMPLPASIGRICPHPCEEACRRQLVEEPIAIATLKYFPADLDLKSDNPYMPEIKAATGERVAIVGAGPAGLTAAYFLAWEGHEVTVYDAMPQGGGMLRYGIPEYRLPKDILDKEIELISRMRVKFKFNTRIGRDISLDYLRTHNEAVFLAIGAWQSSALGSKGEDLPGVLGGIDFLREAALHGNVKIGEQVAVVGGGNTAMDAARTAVRLGAGRVMVLYRRTRAEMPAADIEIREAEEEGIEFRFLVAPLEVTAQDGQVNGIRMQKMKLGEPDSSGRRSPLPIPGAEELIPVDMVISAIGQKVEPAGLEDLKLTRWGTIEADPDTLLTSLPGVFAGGDGVTGPRIAVDAAAQGRKAARAINNHLDGVATPEQELYVVEQEGLSREDFADWEKVNRVQVSCLEVKARRNNFREVSPGFSEEEAVKEANRCLECGCKDYFECRLVKYANDYEVEPGRIQGEKRRQKVHEQHPFIERNSEKCILCGLCVRVCDEVMGVAALGLVHRGFESIVQPEFTLPLKESSCIACGQCAFLCPTGALMEHYPTRKNLPLAMAQTRTVCSFCGVGCEQIIGSGGDMVMRAWPAPGELLCRKGRFGWEAFGQGRLTMPMVRRNGLLVEATWPEAFKYISHKVQSIKDRYGSPSLALFVSPSYTMEEAGAAAELGRLVLETKNLSSFTGSSIMGLEKIYGGNISTNTFEQLNATNLILMVGSFNESQIAAIKIRNAVKSGARLIIISPEASLADDRANLKIKLAGYADRYDQRSTNEKIEEAGFLKQILAAILNKGLIDDEFITARINGFQELKRDLASIAASPEAETIAEMYGKAEKAMIMVDGSLVTRAGVELLTNLALITGKIGSPGNGIIVVTPGGNQAGLHKVGITGDGERWAGDFRQGSLKGVFILGEDPIGAGTLTPEDVKNAELKVVMSPFLTPTAEAADVVLPGSTPLETSGTYISCEGKIKSVQQVKMPVAGLENREIIAALAKAMNVNLESLYHKTKQPTWNDPIKFAPGFALADDQACLIVADGCQLFAPVPVNDPAMRWFNEKLIREGMK